MDYQIEYNKKKMTAQAAAGLIKSGDRIDYGWSCNTTAALDAALAKRMNELENLIIYGGILLREPEIFKVENAACHFTWNSWHMGGIERKSADKGFAYYCPIRYSELPRYYRENIRHLDIAVMQVSPMDKHGYFSFGPTPSHMMAVCEIADVIILEVNKNVPRCLGGFEEALHISKADYIIEGCDGQLPELPVGHPNDIDRKVAKLITEDIQDGACLQLGIGNMPTAVGTMIAESDLKDLGIHTEMYVESFIDIANAGKITGAYKNIDRFKQTFAFAAGTRRLYDYLDDNLECMAVPVNYTNDVRTISRLDNFISINNAVDIDLFGQIESESSGIRHISGAGGQMDFVMGAYLSKNGKSFICLSSTFQDKTGETRSRILPVLKPGSVITDTRPTVQYLVTEFGKVDVKGGAVWERCEKIISIAHPDFRDSLIKEAEKMHIWRNSNRR